MCNQVFSFQGPTCINTTRISSKFFSLQNPKKSDKKKSLIKKQTIKTKTIEQANENKRRTTKENFRTEILSIRNFLFRNIFFLLPFKTNNEILQPLQHVQQNTSLTNPVHSPEPRRILYQVLMTNHGEKVFLLCLNKCHTQRRTIQIHPNPSIASPIITFESNQSISSSNTTRTNQLQVKWQASSVVRFMTAPCGASLTIYMFSVHAKSSPAKKSSKSYVS